MTKTEILKYYIGYIADYIDSLKSYKSKQVKAVQTDLDTINNLHKDGHYEINLKSHSRIGIRLCFSVVMGYNQYYFFVTRIGEQKNE
jgi:hypothetical protein